MRTLLVPITALLLAAGCSSGSSRTVSGQLDLTQMHPQNAQVVAISASGRVFRAPISATGSFAISLPTNAKYTLRFANATNVASRYDAFATLKPRRAAGAQTHWFTVTGGSAINLGRVGRVGTVTPQTAGIKTQSDGADDGTMHDVGDDNGGDDGEEDDGAEACDVQNGQDDVDVESENDVNDSVDSDKDGQADSVDTDNNNGTCNVATQDGECELNDDQGQELDDDADKSCTTAGGGGTPAPTPAPGVSG
jgi:hypothetical protein